MITDRLPHRWFLEREDSSIHLRQNTIVGSGSHCDLRIVHESIGTYHAKIKLNGQNIIIQIQEEHLVQINHQTLYGDTYALSGNIITFGEIDFELIQRKILIQSKTNEIQVPEVSSTTLVP